jgi:SAM-dependent methyltransferase
MCAALGALIAAWYAIASFAAFHWMFDRSPFLSGAWLVKCVGHAPQTCVQVSVCAEQTVIPIQSVFPHCKSETVDLFDESITTEPAIARARQHGLIAAAKAAPDALPFDDDSTDLVVVTLAAHEIRHPQRRESLFKEIARIVAPDGRVVVVEHLRNLSAALAFGPGLFHFYPRGEWVRLARAARLTIAEEFHITPFVHVFVLRNR